MEGTIYGITMVSECEYQLFSEVLIMQSMIDDQLVQTYEALK